MSDVAGPSSHLCSIQTRSPRPPQAAHTVRGQKLTGRDPEANCFGSAALAWEGTLRGMEPAPGLALPLGALWGNVTKAEEGSCSSW